MFLKFKFGSEVLWVIYAEKGFISLKQLCPLQKPTTPTLEKVQFHSWLKML